MKSFIEVRRMGKDKITLAHTLYVQSVEMERTQNERKKKYELEKMAHHNSYGQLFVDHLIVTRFQK